MNEVDRRAGFSSTTILGDRPHLVIPGTARNPRSENNFFVSGPHGT
ncbi:hypothetical protein [Mycolicibacterium doricum]|nr:hypothetical protein [Mycolicibacterium doricum]MCV7269501.1 hypothetical protein [Mycolicibacterium doricum]